MLPTEKPLSPWKKRGLLFLKIAVLLLSFGYIYYRVSHNEQFNEQFGQLFTEQFTWPNLGFLGVCLLLVPVNWLLEARKWQLLIRPIEQTTLYGALKSVLTGLAIGFVSEPHIGGFLGRAWQIKSSNRFRVLGASLLNSSCQNYITVVVGTFGFFYLNTTAYRIEPSLLAVLALIDVFFLSFLSALIFYGKWFIRPLQRYKLVYPYVKIVSEYPPAFVRRVVGLSLLRFSLYMTQFWLVLHFFGSELPLWPALASVSMMYLAKAILPSFSFLSELGIREFTALYFFGLYAVPEHIVIASTLLIWIINVLFPAMAGFYFAWHLNVLKSWGAKG